MSRTTIRNLIIATLLLTIALGGVLFSVWILKGKEKMLATQFQTLQKERDQENLFYKIKKVSEDSKDDRATLAGHVLRGEGDSIAVLSWIEEQAPKVGVTLETKNLQNVTDKDTKTNWLEINFNFSGDRESVDRFITVLENIAYVSTITTLNFGVKEGGEWQADATLRVLIFKYHE